jgi:hypothetical protein
MILRKKRKKESVKEWFNKKVNDTTNWIRDNKETLAIAVPVIAAGLSGTTKIIKGISKNVALKQEKELKEKFIYDRSLGKYLELKKPLNSNQLKTVLERKENGEKLSTILNNMNLLK